MATKPSTCVTKPVVTRINENGKHYYYTVYDVGCSQTASSLNKTMYIEFVINILTNTYNGFAVSIPQILNAASNTMLLQSQLAVLLGKKNNILLNSGNPKHKNIILLEAVHEIVEYLLDKQTLIQDYNIFANELEKLLQPAPVVGLGLMYDSIKSLAALFRSLKGCVDKTNIDTVYINSKQYTVYNGYCAFNLKNATNGTHNISKTTLLRLGVDNANTYDAKAYLQIAKHKVLYILGMYLIMTNVLSILSEKKVVDTDLQNKILDYFWNLNKDTTYDENKIHEYLKQNIGLVIDDNSKPLNISNLLIGLNLIKEANPMLKLVKDLYTFKHSPKQTGGDIIQSKPKVIHKSKERIVHKDKHKKMYIILNKDRVYLSNIKGQYRYINR